MKTKLVTLIALAASVVVTGAKASLPSYDYIKSGAVTIALTSSYEVGGFDGDYHNTITDTDSLYRDQYKSNVAKAKYGNAEFIADIIDNANYNYFENDFLPSYLQPLLETDASDWSLIYVESDYFDYENDSGFFLVNSDNGDVVYVGGYYTGDSSPLNLYYGTGISAESGLYTEIRDGGDFVSSTNKYRFKAQETTYITFTPYYNYDYGYDDYQFYTTGLLSYSSSVTESYDGESVSYVYKPSTASIKNIIGDDDGDDDVIFTGSLKTAALRDVTDEELAYSILYAYDQWANWYD